LFSSIKLFYFIFILVLALLAYSKRYYNWDMLGYIGCIISIEESNIDSIHSKVYQLAKKDLPAKEYEALIDSNNDYRSRAFQDATYFYGQLNLYRIKPLYVLLIYLFYKIGVPLVTATILPSVLSFVAIGLILFYWMTGYVKKWLACILSALIMLSPPLWEIVLSSTPDAFGDLIVLSAFYLILEKNKILAGLIFLLISIWIRIDFILLVMMTIIWLNLTKAVFKKISTMVVLSLSVISVLSFAVIAIQIGDLNLNSITYYSIIPSNLPNQLGTSLFSEYILLLVRGIHDTVHATVSLFLFLGIVTMSYRRRTLPLKSDFEGQVILLLLINILLRYLLHPVLDDRFLVAHYLVITILFIKTFLKKNEIAAHNSGVN